ncbi:HAD family hydrolase [Actinoplanes regularis]|uniref:Phosphoglycolate phosphatase, HAD superfamily n=1 Tax=Actinoplanes regularis TaxID=52697 RepID=A0A239JNB5_9ACTN|nr:HAD family hydrolase [Actinoplanes regularis]SNT07327.1 Phosphoglycolate phosphatase, HAD superfamily [Actinoplanes regularis]
MATDLTDFIAAGPRVRHIVWDWNGTILGDSGALIAATVDALAACGFPSITRADYQRHHCQPIPLFYERLVGRALDAREQQRLDECFRAAYARHRRKVNLTADASVTLRRWAATGATQSLLSMYPHAELVPLVSAAGLASYFARIDGSMGTELAHKAPHLARHLRYLGLEARQVLLVGDSVDDARAARECGVRCVIYHAGEDALHARGHFADLGVPVVSSLRAAVDAALVSATASREHRQPHDHSPRTTESGV